MQDPSFSVLESKRLRIRRFGRSDAEDLSAYRSDPNVARYQAWQSCSVHEAQRFIESIEEIAPGTPGRWFQFAVTLGSSESLIGDCALRCGRSESRQAELGFTFSTECQGHGYASEAVARVLEYAFTTLDLHRVFAVTDERNSAARKLLERLEFRCEGRFVRATWFKGEWASELLFAQLREEWQQ